MGGDDRCGYFGSGGFGGVGSHRGQGRGGVLIIHQNQQSINNAHNESINAV